MDVPVKHTYNCPIVSRGLSNGRNDCHLEEAITFHRDLAVFVNGVARRHHGYLLPTVDGKNPAPPGMYKAL